MREDWIEVELKEVSDRIHYGYTATAKKNKAQDDCKYLRITDIQNGQVNWSEVPFCDIPKSEISKFQLNKYDLVFARTGGTVGKSYLIKDQVPKKAVFASYLIRVKINKSIEPKFVYNFFQSLDYWEQINLNKVGLKTNVNAQILAKLKFNLPPLPEQRAIVAKIEQLLSELDAGIASLKKAEAQLKTYRQAVLKKAFEGELTKAWRTQQSNLPTAEALLVQIKEERAQHHAQQLADWAQAVKTWEAEGKEGKKPAKPKTPKEVAPLSEEELKQLPNLPEGWGWNCLVNIAELIGGVTKGRKLDGQKLISLPYLRVANVQDGYLDLTHVKVIDVLPSDLDKYKLYEGDILYTEGGDKDKLGRGTIWRNEIENCIHQNHIFRARLYLKDMPPKFIGYYSQTRTAKKYFFSKAKQTTNLASINLTVLSNLPFPLCSLPEQRQIVQEIESRLSVCDQVEASIQTGLAKAEALRQSILKKAFEGRLLSDAELVTCKNEKDWAPASTLLAQIEAEKAQAEAKAPKKASRGTKKKTSVK
ncbi:restriction endonuclease subunit S [uncultured Microscilla sp.]|uniref:restriction endonuclease subunit S n=1 Tax=uncultured Microscilla sp. TaxID=432653 RepID=UPI002625CE3F|nr:restriction endonuclease subunit S [uncultured Microscilla sp.]